MTETTKSIWARIVEFNNVYFPSFRKTHPVFYSNALAGEVGEVCDAIKHFFGGGTNHTQPKIQDVAFELFDAYVYTVMLCESLGVGEREYNAYCSMKLAELVRRTEGETKQPIELKTSFCCKCAKSYSIDLSYCPHCGTKKDVCSI